MPKRKFNHYEKIQKVKLFARVHSTLTGAFREINCSIYTDPKDNDDIWFKETSNEIIKYLEAKMMGDIK